MKIGIRGKYNVKVVRDGEVIQETGWRGNLVTDNGLQRYSELLSIDSILSGTLFVGSSSTPPTNNSGIGSPVAFTTSSSSNPRYMIYDEVNTPQEFGLGGTTRYTFPLGAVVGNITELGISSYAGSGGHIPEYMRTHALITDTGGNPIAITVTSEDQLLVDYGFEVLGIPTSIPVQSFTLDGTPYDVKMVFCGEGTVNSNYIDVSEFIFGYQQWGVNSGDIPGSQEWPNGTIANTGFYRLSPEQIPIEGTYPINTKAKRYRVNTSEGNSNSFPSGIGLIVLQDNANVTFTANFCLEFNPPLVKTDQQIFEYEVFVTVVRI